MAKYYVTTAIDYVNAEPHIGHAYQKIVADVLARWHKLQGNETFFLTGTDEHGKKVAGAAEKAGKEPKTFVDEISKKFKEAWKLLHIEPSRFIRTTDADHQKVVQELIKKINDKGDIYKDKYKGLYCTGCEAYYTEKEAADLQCPVHKKALETLEEESYFFKLSKYQDFLLELYEKHPEFVLPEERRNEVINRVKEGLKDLSITRTSFNWGIPFPLEEGHVTYVWFEALMNYYSATQEKGKEKFWPANVHLLGKDNTWFHCVYWPAILKAAELPLPKVVFNHGFLTFNGEKISKSLGNAIAITSLVEKYGADAIRYFCLRQVPFGEDGDFAEEDVQARLNNELANDLGNLVSRSLTLVEKYFDGKIPEGKNELSFDLKKVEEKIEDYAFHHALEEIWKFVHEVNKYINDKKPWEAEEKAGTLYTVLDSLRILAIVLEPFIPETASKITTQLGVKQGTFADVRPNLLQAGGKIKKGEILFKKLE